MRCTLLSHFGRRPSDGFANRPFANVGVHYGLNAVNSGKITPRQFADLNARVGGLDIDWKWQPQRSTADLAALTTACRAGLVTHPAAAATVPIIDVRGGGDVEIHTDVHSHIPTRGSRPEARSPTTSRNAGSSHSTRPATPSPSPPPNGPSFSRPSPPGSATTANPVSPSSRPRRG